MEEVRTFAFCSMQYHLRYRLGLPWFETSHKAGLAVVIRQSLLEYFRLESRNVDRKKSLTSSEAVLEDGIRRLIAEHPQRTSMFLTKKVEISAAMLTIASLYSPGRDEMIAADLPVAIAAGKGNEAVTIRGNVDAIYYQNVRTQYHRVVALTFVSTEDPFEDFLRYQRIREGFAHMVLRKVEPKYYIPVMHKSVPVIKQVHKQLQIAKGPIRLEAANPEDGRLLRSVLLQVKAGIESGYAIPTAESGKCGHCPYKQVCSFELAHAKTDDVKGIHARLQVQKVASRLHDWPRPGRLK